jgi:hypothetical protein
VVVESMNIKQQQDGNSFLREWTFPEEDRGPPLHEAAVDRRVSVVSLAERRSLEQERARRRRQIPSPGHT